MGRESEYTDPLLRFGFGQRLPGSKWDRDGALVEILLEPIPGKKASDIEWVGTKILEGEVVMKLRHFVWLRVSEAIANKLRSNKDFQLNIRGKGVARVWPNLPLYPLGLCHPSSLADGLSLPFATIGANVQSVDGDGVKWAVIDTDVRDSHSGFSGATIERWQVTDQGVTKCTTNFSGPCGHGTHVTGIIHALAPKAVIVSIALDVQTLPGNDEAPFLLLSTAHLEKALEWISIQSDIQGINISLGIDPITQDHFVGHGPGCRALGDCVAAGKVVVVAAGNCGERANEFREVSITDPANARGAFVVGACSSTAPYDEGIWSKSSHGPTADGRMKPDIVAPGVAICSCSHIDDHTYVELSGTSQGAAFVSGTLAALMSRTASTQPISWEDLIKQTAKDLERDRTYQGQGLLQFDIAASKLP